ncbi:alpha/beta hydrolase [Tautonia plasticadhaerens]|uniref:Endo-1,4-beta-xylanase Z n=1 Tax=Tautonia plasticadhaerens TaxID=2527974 RepID=A0A518H143_9BACT|nr:alpha/beta hydrolase-fold protein [Tautonia plasticadhaerens]QDV34554.1 Endo-1,4-beta-xylanase Z precursor [Tautonia plasticadhaerens]
MRRWRVPIAAMVLLIGAGSSHAQFRDLVNIDWVNHRLSGHVDDYTQNHSADRRLHSPILGRPRDLYVYTPPGYDPRRSYPVILWLHMGYVDEHVFLGSPALVRLDRMILRGEMPPVVVACPDGLYSGENRTGEPHSLFVNGRGGRFEDHLVGEVLPFVTRHYSIRPERQAHAILGLSGGGFGGMSIAIRRRDLFGAVATLASPVNIRYDDARPKGPREDFSPASYRWKEYYDPEEVYAVFYFGLRRSRARKYIEPVFGSGPEVTEIIRALNPADLLFTTDLEPGELAMFCHFGGRDNWNFDAQALSFAWLAASRGVHVELATAPLQSHSIHYFRDNQDEAYRYLGRHLLPPTGPWILAPRR